MPEPPQTFNPTDQYHDSNLLSGLPLPRTIAATAWTRQHNFAGMPLQDIKLLLVVYKGWENWQLRSFANGYFVNAILTRSMKETVFMNELLHQIRQSKIDLDATARKYADSKKIAIDLSSNDGKAKALRLLIPPLVDTLQPYIETFGSTYDLDTIQKKEEENAELRAQIAALEQQSKTPTSSTSQRRQKVALPVHSDDTAPDADKTHDGPDDASDLIQKLFTRAKSDFLAQNPPPAHTPSKITAWINAFKLTAPQRKSLTTFITKTGELFKSIPPPQFELLRQKCVGWGLPVSTAAHLSKVDLLRVAAITVWHMD